jgi:RNA polymerase sigma factor (sigma-70 family)
LAFTLGRQPTIKELSSALGVSESEIQEAHDIRNEIKSLEATKKSRGAEMMDCLADFIPDDSNTEEEAEQIINRKIVESVVKALPPLWQTVIKKKYGLLGCQETTVKDIANELGVSKQRIQQIEHASLLRMKSHLGKNNINF